MKVILVLLFSNEVSVPRTVIVASADRLRPLAATARLVSVPVRMAIVAAMMLVMPALVYRQYCHVLPCL